MRCPRPSSTGLWWLRRVSVRRRPRRVGTALVPPFLLVKWWSSRTISIRRLPLRILSLRTIPRCGGGRLRAWFVTIRHLGVGLWHHQSDQSPPDRRLDLRKQLAPSAPCSTTPWNPISSKTRTARPHSCALPASAQRPYRCPTTSLAEVGERLRRTPLIDGVEYLPPPVLAPPPWSPARLWPTPSAAVSTPCIGASC